MTETHEIQVFLWLFVALVLYLLVRVIRWVIRQIRRRAGR